MNPPDTKKGAIPLDAAVKTVEHANSEASPERASEQTQDDKPALDMNDPATFMGVMLNNLYGEVRKGHVQAMAVVFLDGSGVPQLAYHVGANAAVSMVGGMTIAIDALKDGAKQSMEGYRQFLAEKAAHDAKASGAGQAEASQEVSAASAESTSKPN